LPQGWQQWVKLMELFATRSPLRLRVADQDYGPLHRRLLESCRSLANESEGDRQRFYQSLAELAQPWLSLAVLAQTDRKILMDLLECCRRAEREASSRKRLLGLPRWSVPAAAFLAAAGVTIVLPAGLDRLGESVVDWLTRMSNMLSSLLASTPAGHRLLMAGVALVLAAILAVLHARFH
jgi:hypothetical protein